MRVMTYSTFMAKLPVLFICTGWGGGGYVKANNVFAVFLLIFSYNIYSDARHWHQCK